MIVLIILLIIVNVIKKNNKKPEIKNVGKMEITITEKSVNLENFDEVLSELPMKGITMRIKVQDFTLEYVKKIYASLKKASDKEIEKYYKENVKEVQSFLYVADITSFKTFVKQLSRMDSEKLTCTEIVFEKDTFQKMNSQASFEVKYDYEDYLNYRVHVINLNEDNVDENQIIFEVMI